MKTLSLEWNERQVASPLDGLGQHPLVTGTRACLPPAANPALLGHHALDQVDLFVIDDLRLFGAELTHVRASDEAPARSTALASAARRTFLEFDFDFLGQLRLS